MRLFARFESADGAYVDAAGVRFAVSEVRRVRNAAGVNVGYEAFASLQDALEAWGLRVSPAELLSTPTQGGSQP